MSDGMERDKIEILTAKEREKEKEEMKRELLDMKMYEAWYTYKDMKQILGFINESKDMANIANDEKNTQKELLQSANDCNPEVMPKTNLTQDLEIQEHNDTSQSVHSYKSNIVCSSPDLTPLITASRNNTYRGKNLDSENMFVRLQDNSNLRDCYSDSTNRYILLKSNNSLQDSDITNSTENKMDTNSDCAQKLERRRINPLDSCVSENDVPLQEPYRPIVEDHMPFRLCKDTQTSEVLEKLLPTLNINLNETAELWHSGHSTTNTKIQWGSPIQVGHPKNNSDKKMLENINTKQNKVECTGKHYNDRPNKRKSASILFPSSSDEEQILKKKKTRDDTSRVLRSHQETSTARYSKTDEMLNSNHDDIDNFFDSTESKHIRTEYNQETKEHSLDEMHSVSQKNIMPPNVRKTINKKKEHLMNVSSKSPLAHGSNEKRSAITSRDINNTLTNEDILIELENDNTKNNIKTISESIEIKPLPIKGLSRRIKNECTILEKIQIEKLKKIETEKQQAQRKEQEEKEKREEFYKKQIEERQRKEKQKEEKEKHKEEKWKKWKNITDMRSQKKDSKEDKQKLQGLNTQNEYKISEVTEESRMFQDNNIVVSMHTENAGIDITNNVNCPICNKSFPSSKIETHAAECEQYMSGDEYEDSELLKCAICSRYRTTDGIRYEEHVNNCLQRQYREASSNEFSTNEINNIPNSPIRCYRPISELTDSHIDYRRQFASDSKTQIHSNRKRKR